MTSADLAAALEDAEDAFQRTPENDRNYPKDDGDG